MIRQFMSSGHMKAMRFAAWAAWFDDDDSNKVEYGSQRVKVGYFIFLMSYVRSATGLLAGLLRPTH